MTEYITQEQLNQKMAMFVKKPVLSLDSPVNIDIGNELIRSLMETEDKTIFESTFCDSYKEIKYLAALSAQIGCASKCNFCQLGNDGLKRNLTGYELVDQLRLLLSNSSKSGHDIYSKPVKATFVMGGEPLANHYLPKALRTFKDEIPLQLKISSVLPDTRVVRETYQHLIDIAKDYPNPVQFQVSLNSTNNNYRQSLTKINLIEFNEIREMGESWQSQVPNARKVNLTFTINQETPMDPEQIIDILPPELFAIRLREFMPTEVGKNNGLEKIVDDRVKKIRDSFAQAGYLMIPGSPGKLEKKFKLAPGETIQMYKKMIMERY